MTPLSYADNCAPQYINEVMHNINPDTISISWTQPHYWLPTTHKTHDNF